MKRILAAICAALVTLLSAGSLRAHEGHDHDAKPPPANASIAPRGEAASELFELAAIVEGSELAIYLDRFATNEPVEGATVEVETPGGPVKASPRAGDAYRLPAPFLAKPGRYDLIVTVTAKGAVDVLPVTLEIPEPRPGLNLFGDAASEEGRSSPMPFVLAALAVGFIIGASVMAFVRRRRIVVATVLPIVTVAMFVAQVLAHEGEEQGTAVVAPRLVSRDLAQRLADSSVFVPKSTQRILAIRTTLTTEGSYRSMVELPGRIIPDPNASGLVQASVGGRLSPPPGGFPKLGTPVAKGDVLAYVTPPLQAIDVSDMRQRQGELDQQISIVERRVARYEPLVASGAVTRVQLDEARLELQGLRDRRAAIDHARGNVEALVAPVSGIVADGSVVAGQMASPNMIVFQIVDPAKLWIEALSFDALVGTKTATAVLPSGRSLTLSYQGSGFADRNQSVPIHFAIEGNVKGLRVGQFVMVLASTGEEQKGLAVPRSSVVRAANGQDIVYEHSAAERFQPRPVRIEPLDGERVLIATGIGLHARIVTQGAELLDQVR